MIVRKNWIFRRAYSFLQKAMIKDRIIPDVIDTGPAEFASIVFNSGAMVDCGNELTPTQVRQRPSVGWYCSMDSYYTICLTDPDAPSRKNPLFREWHHWLVVNIPGNSVSLGETLSEYVGSAPPEGTGLHRYVYLIYKQPKRITFEEERLSNSSDYKRAKFKVQEFAKKYKMGDPVAGNYYFAKYDDYVPLIYKQLSPMCPQ